MQAWPRYEELVADPAAALEATGAALGLAVNGTRGALSLGTQRQKKGGHHDRAEVRPSFV